MQENTNGQKRLIADKGAGSQHNLFDKRATTALQKRDATILEDPKSVLEQGPA
jgi:hypothetical protein